MKSSDYGQNVRPVRARKKGRKMRRERERERVTLTLNQAFLIIQARHDQISLSHLTPTTFDGHARMDTTDVARTLRLLLQTFAIYRRGI